MGLSCWNPKSLPRRGLIQASVGGRGAPRCPRSSPTSLTEFFGAFVKQRLHEPGACGQRLSHDVKDAAVFTTYNDARLLQAQQAGVVVHASGVFLGASNLAHRNEVGNGRFSVGNQHGFARLYLTKIGAQAILHFGNRCSDHLLASGSLEVAILGALKLATQADTEHRCLQATSETIAGRRWPRSRTNTSESSACSLFTNVRKRLSFSSSSIVAFHSHS